ncbi:MAG: biotin--[acetyl-CoA-carboxylase] ligase, partial [Alphaproteobacteria bacterium]|nr:biotin--[acetyl-CoA-carboxylase] ligase [Alphaproteobacteria bacterium]
MSFEIVHFDAVTSTMDAAMGYYKQGGSPPFAIVADEQTQGRGRRGHTWISMRGNLFVTYVVTCPKRMVSHMSFVAALSVHETLVHYKKINDEGRRQKSKGIASLSLKWPNDILFYGKKVAGILIDVMDNRDDYTVLGIGVGMNTRHA